MRVTVPIVSDQPNKNGVVYPKSVVDKAMEKFMAKKVHHGELNPPEPVNCIVNLGNSAISVDLADYKDGEAILDVGFLACGNGIKAMDKLANGSASIKPRLFGSGLADGGQITVTDLNIVTFDVVDNKEEIAVSDEKQPEEKSTCSCRPTCPCSFEQVELYREKRFLNGDVSDGSTICADLAHVGEEGGFKQLEGGIVINGGGYGPHSKVYLNLGVYNNTDLANAANTLRNLREIVTDLEAQLGAFYLEDAAEKAEGNDVG